LSIHFQTVGFDVASRRDYEKLIRTAARDGIRVRGHGEFHYMLWEPGNGIELWVQVNQAEQIIGCHVHVPGHARLRMGIVELVQNYRRPSEGGLYGWADPETIDAQAGRYPLYVSVPDFIRARIEVETPVIAPVQVTAFPLEITCYDSLADYERDPWESPEAGKMGAQVFLPTGVLDTDLEHLQPEATFTGIIKAVEERANPLTGKGFAILLVETVGGHYDVLVSNSALIRTPKVEGVVKGSFWLSGRVDHS
jgi:hypothetical protein